MGYIFHTQVDDAAPVSETVDGVTDGSGEGFNTLAGYLFGNNTQEVAMDMTTPVNIDVSPAGGRWVPNYVSTTVWHRLYIAERSCSLHACFVALTPPSTQY